MRQEVLILPGVVGSTMAPENEQSTLSNLRELQRIQVQWKAAMHQGQGWGFEPQS